MGKLGADAPLAPAKGAAQQKLGVANLLAPKDNPSQMGEFYSMIKSNYSVLYIAVLKKNFSTPTDTSEITSLCSLTASQGADDYYFLQQMSGER